MTTPISPVLIAIYEAAKGLYRAGVIDSEKLREYYELVYANHLTDRKLDVICKKILKNKDK